METLIFGGGGIAEGISKVVPAKIYQKEYCNILEYSKLYDIIRFSQPDVVINCAGVSNPGDFKNIPFSKFDEEIDVNLKGSFNIAKASIYNNVGTMIFIASVAGLYGKANHAGYCASKAGVISMVQSLGQEGYNAYAISPGRVDTKMREKDYPGEDKRTRLSPEYIGVIVSHIIKNLYKKGDNIIVRKTGFDLRLETDLGQPWRRKLNIPPFNINSPLDKLGLK